MSTYADAFELKKHIIEDKMKTYEPLSAILNTIIGEIEAEGATNYDDVAPAMQHEESQHRLQHAKQSESLGLLYPDRPENQKYYDTGPELQMCLPTFEDSVEIIAERMCDIKYRKHLQSFSKRQQEFFTHIMHIAKSKSQQLTCCLHGGAGPGKSNVLTALYQGLYLLLCDKAGQN